MKSYSYIDYAIASISIYCDEGIDSHFKILYEKSENVSLYFVDPHSKTKVPKEIVINKGKKLKKQNIVPVQIFGDSTKYALIDNEFKKLVIVPERMKSIVLYPYYLKLCRNIDTTDLVHFGITQNECIKRGLIDDIPIQSLNDFNTDIGA